MQTPPLARMPVPHHIESRLSQAFFHMIEAGERGIEFFAEIVWVTRAIARDEAVLAPPLLAANIDRMGEPGRTDLGQETRF
jgi:hypothetical protein